MPAPRTRADATLDALARAQEAFATLLDAADPDALVPACGTWTVTDLALHLGGVHAWAAGMARGTDDGGDDPTGPREPAALRATYREQAAELLATLRALPADAPGLTLNGPGPASFWHRRQLHETLVHLHDLADATGVPHPVTDPAPWADAVDEVVTVLAPRQVRLGRATPWVTPVRLAATDLPCAWTLASPGRPVAEADAVAATVTGPAVALALLLWGRTTTADPRLAVSGDAEALADVLGRALTP